MQSIESSPHPLAFRAADPERLAAWPADPAGGLAVRCLAGALTGMQKQGLLRDPASGAVWNMLCDEGPYLNGTDLAPFPLAFFTAGMAVSIRNELEALAAERGRDLGGGALILDNYYTMEGSALKATMTGGALAPEITLECAPGADKAGLRELVSAAVAASPVSALLREELQSVFTLVHNGAEGALGRVTPLTQAPLAAPFEALAAAEPEDGAEAAGAIIEKLSAAESVFGVEGGAGSSLEATQKRQLHVRGIADRRDDGLLEVKVQLFRPIGSVFKFLADDGSRFHAGQRAPSGLAYLSAGIAFCFLTQLGRFAHIAKQDIQRYGVVQDTQFSLPGASAGTGTRAWARPVETHVHVDSPESGESVAHLVDMGEQTCFLHAACRTPVKPKLRGSAPRREAA